MTYFDNNDPIWEETAGFLEPLIDPKKLVMGPESFVNVLPNVLAYDLLGHFSPDFFDFVIVHKGECMEMGNRFLESWEQHYSAIFANPVFVIFAKQKSKEIEREGDDFKSLANQIQGLPPEPRLTHFNEDQAVYTDNLNFRPVVDFLKQNISDHDLIFAPPAVCALFKNTFDAQTILRTSLNTANFAVFSVYSAPDFPYQDLKDIAQSYHPVYSNEFFAIFTRNDVAIDDRTKGGFAEVIQTAMLNEDYLVTLRAYRDMVVGKTA